MRRLLTLLALAMSLPSLHAQQHPGLVTVGPSRAPLPTANTARALRAPWPDVIYIAPVPNAPFTATIVGDRTSVKSISPNSQTGEMIFAGNHRLIARDAAGRLLMEQRAFVHNGQKDESELLATDFVDAAGMKFVRCIPSEKTCHVYPLRTTEKGYLTYTAIDWPALGLSAAQFSGLRGNTTIKSLGEKDLEGIPVVGYSARREFNLRGGDISKTVNTNNNIETYTGEIWYSADLQSDLKMSYSNSNGDHTDIMKDIKRGPPDPKLFQIPAGYKVVAGD